MQYVLCGRWIWSPHHFPLQMTLDNWTINSARAISISIFFSDPSPARRFSTSKSCSGVQEIHRILFWCARNSPYFVLVCKKFTVFCSGVQEIHRILQNQEVRYRVQKSPTICLYPETDQFHVAVPKLCSADRKGSATSCQGIRGYISPMDCLFFSATAPPPRGGQGLLIHEVCRSHTTKQHGWQDSSGRVISSSQRPLPDNT